MPQIEVGEMGVCQDRSKVRGLILVKSNWFLYKMYLSYKLLKVVLKSSVNLMCNVQKIYTELRLNNVYLLVYLLLLHLCYITISILFCVYENETYSHTTAIIIH